MRIEPIVFASYPVVLAAVALGWLIAGRRQTWHGWALRALACGSIVLFVFLAGPWAFSSYYLRFAVMVLYAGGVIYSYAANHPARGDAHEPRRVAGSAAVLLLFSSLNVLVLASHVAQAGSVDVEFPLTSGSYYVLQGGNSAITNPFHALSGTPLAVDITKLNSTGNRARGIAPTALDAYEIFGDVVHSPCAGTVASVHGDFPDNAPGNVSPHANYVVIKCGDVDIILVHLLRGSIVVAPGERIELGQPLAKVGNSGYTLEPHLHVGATRRREEIGITFGGRFLSINSVVTADTR